MPLTVSFDASGSNDLDGTIATYEWHFGDGFTSTGQSVSYTYNEARSNPVILIVTDDDGATATETLTIEVSDFNEAPTAAFTATPTAGDAPLIVSFDAAGSSDSDGSVISYSWDFGDGSTDSGQIVNYSYSLPGTYTAVLTITDNESKTATASQTITVNSSDSTPPIAAFTVSSSFGVAPFQVDFDASTAVDPDGGSIDSYSWDFGDSANSTGVQTSHTYSAPGVYTVGLEASDNSGATGATNQTITVVQSEGIAFLVSPEDDAYVRGGGAYKGLNYGSEDILYVQKGLTNTQKRESFLRFDVSDFSGQIASAGLQLYPTEVVGEPTQGVYFVNNTTWNENTITYSTKPAATPQITTWSPAAGEPTYINITSYVQDAIDNNEQLSLSILSETESNDAWAVYGSKENAELEYQPYLVIHIAAAAASCGEQCVPTTILLNDLPGEEWLKNTRAFTAAFSDVTQPSLSINGFDCGSNCDIGLGLKQIIEDVYGDSPTPSIEAVHNKLLDVYFESVGSSSPYVFATTAQPQVENNTRILQAQMYVTLISYIIERNGYDPLDYGLINPQPAMQHIRNRLLSRSEWQVNENKVKYVGSSDKTTDAVKWTEVVANMARVWDLYLALENAVHYYGENGHAFSANIYSDNIPYYLLTHAEKEQVSIDYFITIKRLVALGQNYIPPWVGGLNEKVSGYTTQSGNWPLKIRAAVGLAALQSIFYIIPEEIDINTLNFLDDALKASFGDGSSDRSRYWNYQTLNGKRYWAEGPYYMHFALRDVIPFWHALRLNDMYNWGGVVSVTDPFNDPQYTEPLKWLADIATPDYRTPPLEDGNKRPMEGTSILRWESSYGDADVGRRFAWQRDNDPDNPIVADSPFASDGHVLLVELAIPRLEEGEGTRLAATIANELNDTMGESAEQMLVLRRGETDTSCDTIEDTDECHYILMNAETGNESFERGEGHEQPDQNQLLYYIDDASILMDAGYDKAPKASIGSWSRYPDNNAMIGVQADQGGLNAPELDVRLFPLRVQMDIASEPANHLHHIRHGKIDILYGEQTLFEMFSRWNGSEVNGLYRRNALFINGSDPYLIDFNSVIADPLQEASYHDIATNNAEQLYMRYHVDAESINLNDFTVFNDQFIEFNGIRKSDKNLYMFPFRVELPMRAVNDDVYETPHDVQELFRHEANILYGSETVTAQRVHFAQRGDGNIYRHAFSLANLIRAQSTPPTYTPKLLFLDGDRYTTGDHAGWIWKRSDDVYDIFVARSMRQDYERKIIVVAEDMDGPGTLITFLIPPELDYAFGRAVRVGDEFLLDPEYTLNMGSFHHAGDNGSYGDVNLDGEVDHADSGLVLEHAIGLVTLTNTALANADVTGNGEVTAYDGSFILQKANGLILCFPVEENCGIGDANEDNKLTEADAEVILDHITGNGGISTAALSYADTDGDGSVTAIDASLILQYLSGALECFPADQQCVFDTDSAAKQIVKNYEIEWSDSDAVRPGLHALRLQDISSSGKVRAVKISLNLSHPDTKVKTLEATIPGRLANGL